MALQLSDTRQNQPQKVVDISLKVKALMGVEQLEAREGSLSNIWPHL
jgi:hypothetical protein